MFTRVSRLSMVTALLLRLQSPMHALTLTCRIENTPPPSVPAYSVLGVVGAMARAPTFVLVKPLLMVLQVLPLSVLLNTPPAVLSNTQRTPVPA
jgi:hypothetical protein